MGRGSGRSDYTIAYVIEPIDGSGYRIVVRVTNYCLLSYYSLTSWKLSPDCQPFQSATFFLLAFLQFDFNMTSPLAIDFTTKHPEIDPSLLPDYVSYTDDSELSWPFASEYVSSFRPLSVRDISKRRLTPPWNMRSRLAVAFASRLPFEIIDVICSFIDCPYLCDWVRGRRENPGDPSSSDVPDTGLWEICVTDPKWASHLFELNQGLFGDPFGGRQAGRFRPTRLSLSCAAMLRSRYYRESALADVVDPSPMSDIRKHSYLLRPLCLFRRSCVGSASEEHFVKFRHFDDPGLEGSLLVALPTRILDAVLARGGSVAPVPMILAHHPTDAVSRIGVDPVLAFGGVCHFPLERQYFLRPDSTRDREVEISFGFLLSGGCGPSQKEKISNRRALLKNELLDHDGCPEFIRSHPKNHVLLGFGPALAVFAVRSDSEGPISPSLEFPILLHYWLWGRRETVPLFRFLLRLCDYVPMEAFGRFSSVTTEIVIRQIQQEGGGDLFHEIGERTKLKWDSLLEEEKRRFEESEWWGEEGGGYGVMRPADFQGALADLLETSSRRE